MLRWDRDEKRSSPGRGGREFDALGREIEVTMLRLLAARGAGGMVTVSECALAVGGDGWRGLVDRVRGVAVKLASAGVVEFVWQGRVADPSAGTVPSLIRLTRGKTRSRAVESRLN